MLTVAVPKRNKLPNIIVLTPKDGHGLILQGYAYEEGLNEMSLRRGDDYITMITVAVQRES